MKLHIDSDTSFIAVQHQVVSGFADPTLQFGPLSCNLSKLFEEGYNLRVCGNSVNRAGYTTVKIHLCKGMEKWLVGKIYLSDLLRTNFPLQHYVKGGQMIKNASQDWRSPLDQVMLQYPTKKKRPVIMMGNQTLKEYVKAL